MNDKLTEAVTVKVTKEELAEAYECIELLWPGAPVSQSAMFRHLMKRGCAAVRADSNLRKERPDHS